MLSLPNGVENEEKLARMVGEDHLMGGAALEAVYAILQPWAVRNQRAST